MEKALLSQIKENLRALLQIGLSKEKKRKETMARIKTQTEFRKQGPRSLRPQLREKKGDEELAGMEEIGQFWREIWEERDTTTLRTLHWRVGKEK